jgi:hypothetical protein
VAIIQQSPPLTLFERVEKPKPLRASACCHEPSAALYSPRVVTPLTSRYRRRPKGRGLYAIR